MQHQTLSGKASLYLGALAVVLLAGVLAYDQTTSLNREKEQALQQIVQHDRMLAEHVARSFDSIEILLDEMRIAIQEGPRWQQWDPELGHRILKSKLSRSLPQIRHLLLFDADGYQRHTSFAESPPLINVRDRPYFQQIREGADRARFGPYVGRNSNRPTYAIARRMGKENFEGALMVALEPQYFEDFCRASRPFAEFETAIVNAEGLIVALCRSLQGPMTQRPATAGSDYRMTMADGEIGSATLTMSRSLLETPRFLVSTEPVPGYPDLRIVSATPREQLILAWRAQAWRTIALGAFALAIMFIATLLIRNQLRRLSSLTAELEASQATLSQRIADATRELDLRRAEAIRISESKSRFFAAASHDLRQPLHALQLFLADLSRMTEDPAQRALVERIDSATRAIAKQLRSLLDISRLDMANITPERQHLNLGDVFDQLAGTYASAAESARVRLIFRPLDAVLETDPALLGRMLGNLIDNAIKFAPRGTVLVCARRRPNAVRIEIRDNGRGIAPEHQTQIFDEFFQIENRSRDPNAGLGLGLAIASRIARLIGASISLRSRTGRGAVFSVLLPCSPGRAALHSASTATETVPDLPRLVVLDHSPDAPGQVPDDADEFDNRARRWGYEVARAADVEDAGRELRTPGVILVVRYRGKAPLPDDLQALLRRNTGVVITDAGVEFPELGQYHLKEPVKPARLRALLRSLH